MSLLSEHRKAVGNFVHQPRWTRLTTHACPEKSDHGGRATDGWIAYRVEFLCQYRSQQWAWRPGSLFKYQCPDNCFTDDIHNQFVPFLGVQTISFDVSEQSYLCIVGH